VTEGQAGRYAEPGYGEGGGRLQTTPRSVHRWPGDGPDQDLLAREEPLEIRVEGRSVAVTMRTPGHDRELAAGFLFTEGVVDGADDLVALAHLAGDRDGNTIDVRLAGGVAAHREALDHATRELYATSSCGICGKASIDRIRVLAPAVSPPPELDPAMLVTLPALLRAAQVGFAATGGLHGAALVGFDGRLEVVREDVGRHNAVDKVLGWRLLADRVPVDDRILLVSSRAGFEIVQKARVAGVTTVVCLGAATSLAVDLARDGGQCLVGWLRADRFARYC
jgi:FdhD protein